MLLAGSVECAALRILISLAAFPLYFKGTPCSGLTPPSDLEVL